LTNDSLHVAAHHRRLLLQHGGIQTQIGDFHSCPASALCVASSLIYCNAPAGGIFLHLASITNVIQTHGSHAGPREFCLCWSWKEIILLQTGQQLTFSIHSSGRTEEAAVGHSCTTFAPTMTVPSGITHTALSAVLHRRRRMNKVEFLGG